jgi:ribosome modulation factor
MKRRTLEEAFKAGYLAGFARSGEGYNMEYPYDQKEIDPETDGRWVAGRERAMDKYIKGEIEC